MSTGRESDALGVLGGMGPLASSEFLKTIYEYNLGEREQESPVILMLSDPTFPDRTETFLSGNSDLILGKLIRALDCLAKMGASNIVMCCVTLHYLLPRLPLELRQKIISLVDVIIETVLKSRKRHLLICTNGARELNIFQNNEQWELARDYIALPDERDQQFIHHDLIYQIKGNRDVGEMVSAIESLLSKYGVDSFIAGCTEIHLLSKRFISSDAGAERFGCVDPLLVIAEGLSRKGVTSVVGGIRSDQSSHKPV